MLFHGLLFWWLFGHGIGSIVVLILVVWALSHVFHPHYRGPLYGRSPSAGLNVLEERYAKGDISRDEYLQKKRDFSAG